MMLWLANGWTWSEVAAGQYCSNRTVDRWVKRYQRGGVEALFWGTARTTLDLPRVYRGAGGGLDDAFHAERLRFSAKPLDV